ncbi:DUF11 domain-containing protein [Bacillus pacificus]
MSIPQQRTLRKSADKAFALLGDTITYTISLQNTGTVPATNVLVTDPYSSWYYFHSE